MSTSWVGALAGLVLALLDVALLQLPAGRVALAKTKRVLRTTGLSRIVLLPIIGWFVGPLIAGE